MRRIATLFLIATGFVGLFLMPQTVQAQEAAEDNIVRSDVSGLV